MGPYKRNFFVGATVGLGLLTLGVIIILFGGSLGSFFAGEKVPVTFKSDRGDGISDGSAIRYLGQAVGQVKRIELRLEETPNYVLIHAELDKERPLPANVTASIRVPGLLGSGAVIELEVPKTGAAVEKLKGGDQIATKYVGLGVLPPEFSDLAFEMRGAVRDFREANVIGDVKLAITTFNAQLVKAGKIMDDVDAVLGSEATQTDLKTAIRQFREATQHANAVAQNFEKISQNLQPLPQQMSDTIADTRGAIGDARGAIKTTEARVVQISDELNRNLGRLAQVMDDVRAITHKINTGDGTLALLLNDPKLYNQIVVGTQAINETVKDIQRVVRGFEQEGVPINLGK